MKALKTGRMLVLGLALGCLLGGLAGAGVIEKKYPDGKTRYKYEIDDKGDKQGSYEEFYPSGKPKIKATYKADKRNGPFKSFHDNGKPHVTAGYKDDELDGAYTEETPEGQKLLTATYKEGKLHGLLTRYDKGKPILTQLYKDGEPAYPRSLDDIKKKLAEIAAGPGKSGNSEVDAALRRLKAYRYLAEVPYDNLELDDELTKLAQAAASICQKNGKLDHNPKNPGLSEAEYKFAAEGAARSNLAVNVGPLEKCVDTWMWDSDPYNIERVGHRRWSINPSMQKVGFGKAGNYCAMYAADKSQKTTPDFDFISFPPRGLLPADFFSTTHAWSISLNPRKFKPPTDSAAPKVYQLDGLLNKVGEPLKLNASKVSTTSMGLPNCIIFRPEKVAVAPGRRYLVEVDGLARLDGKPAVLSYVVEFVSLR
jgi:uncharacterized protein YkwD